MKHPSHSFFALLLILLTPLQAQSETLQEVAVRKLIEPHVMDPVDSVTKVPYLGLYEVRTGNQLIYTDAAASYMFFGEIVNAKTSFNYTRARQEELSRIRFEDLPLRYAVKQVKGNGKRTIAIFEDPNCGYCKRLRNTLQSVDNVTIYTFMYDILAPESAAISRNVWCAPQPGNAWDDWMLQNKPAPEAGAACKSPHEQVLALGQKFGVNGTPTIFFVDGSRASGAMDAATLERHLDSKVTTARQ